MACNCCVDSLECGGLVYSSNCVKYGGDDIPSLYITKGDSLSCVITNISNGIADLREGKGIYLTSLDTSCSFISNRLGDKDKTLINILQGIIDNQCAVKTTLDALGATDSYSFDIKCLSVSNTASPDDILQAVINKTCENSSDISVLTTKVNANSNAIKNIQNDISSIKGENDTPVVFTFSQLMPPYVPMPYIGDLSNFDATGKGKAANGYDNIYIMNGANGTQDWRGYSPIGANNGVPGPTLDNRVNPTLNGNFSLSPGNKAGEINHTLSLSEIPSHNHTVNDPGHSHSYDSITNSSHPSGGSKQLPRQHTTAQTSAVKTGITLSSAGGGKSHNNVHPVVATVWIVKLP